MSLGRIERFSHIHTVPGTLAEFCYPRPGLSRQCVSLIPSAVTGRGYPRPSSPWARPVRGARSPGRGCQWSRFPLSRVSGVSLSQSSAPSRSPSVCFGHTSVFCSVSLDVVSGWAQCRPVTANLSPLPLAQCAEKKAEASGPEVESCPELHVEALEALTRAAAGPEGGGVRPEQPFLVLGQEEYGEHHSSIMHCRWVRVGGEAQPGKVLTSGGRLPRKPGFSG